MMESMRNPSLIALLVLMLVLPASLPAKSKPYLAPRVFHAKTYPAHETHDDEKVSIAADPYDMPDKTADVFSINYRAYNLLPIYLIISNDSDQPVSLVNMKVTLVTRKRDKLDPVTVDNMYRRIGRDPNPDANSKFPFPRRKGGLSEAQHDEIDNSRFLARAVIGHTNEAGFIYFDVTGIDNPLAGAKLEITGLMDGKGNDLFFFEIPMEKYLGYKPVAP
jgi:hypothetical protein